MGFEPPRRSPRTSTADLKAALKAPLPPPCVLLLNGGPGVGKFTISKLVSPKQLEDGVVILSTACLYTEEDTTQQFYEYLKIAMVRGIPLVMVNIFCDASANKARLTSDERKSNDKADVKTKLVDPDQWGKIRGNYTQLDPNLLNDHPYERFRKGYLRLLKLDTTQLSAEETAEKVLEFASGATVYQEDVYYSAAEMYQGV
ncbi:uncharacterized protein PAC_03245 [Phialocephala subalpina]|uniref:Uncharacterized protein n=1 Tax=Phialocephala subalpina TaxID=576137 RepID=A0A1L7WKT3_9HELO|nr:uncharacterized protein PAC_03245 [Phialocephala subalpina]